MRTMYDGINTESLPSNASFVAGYISGKWPSVNGYSDSNGHWVPALKARFPKALVVSIATNAGADALCLDIEQYDATPAEAPGWVVRQRKRGVQYPWCYCSQSAWPSVYAEFQKQNVAQPLYWIANYDGVANIPVGAIGKQYHNTAGWDVSVMVDHIVGFDTTPVPVPLPIPVEENEMYIVIDKDPGVEISLLVEGSNVWLLQDADRVAYLEVGIPRKAVSSASYNRLRGKAKAL